MNRYQLNVNEMATTVTAYMAKNKPLWQGNKAISDTVVILDADLATVAGLDVKQKTPVTGQAADKAITRHDFEQQMLLIADQLAALAAKNDDAVLEAQAHLTLANLDKLAADDLVATATRIANLATTNLAALADYNIKAADITQLTTLATAFDTVKTAPRGAVVDRKKETDALRPLISNMLDLLSRQLDRQMTSFKASAPDFYAGYQSARVIVDRGNPAKKKTPATTPPKP
jgi:hypothetical protein